MPYTALYRKKRPRTFKEIVGQPHIKRALINQLAAGQVSHAYLFCGTRGTGKTSAAKIFARAVNCLAPQEGEPCNECELCVNILAERCLDVAEIDAASNNGVENIRDLRDEVKYLPNMGRYKVYIVDEVHMLSTSAFNALLKTLEEPPAHVIFILATTDPQKIPATILSRCQRYDFRRISAEQMVGALRGYLQSEGVAFEDDALDYIAYHSDGAMRDALSLLDQCISTEDALTVEKVRDLLGAVDKARLFEFTDALAAQNTAQIIEIISTAMNDGRDVGQFAADLVRHFRDVLVAGLTDGGEFSAQAAAKFKEQAARIPQELLMRYIVAFSEVQREMRFAPHKRTAFEVCALNICMPQSIPALVQAVQTGQVVAASPAMPAPVAVAVEKPVAAEKPAPPAAPPQSGGSFANIAQNWAAVCQKLAPPIRSQCITCGVEAHDGMLKIICDNESTRQFIHERQEKISNAVAQFFSLSTPPNLAIEVREAYNKPIEQQTPPQPQEPPQAVPADWASFGQEVIGGDDF